MKWNPNLELLFSKSNKQHIETAKKGYTDNAKYNSQTENFYKECKILPLPSLIKFFKLQFMQQYVRGHLPVSFYDVWIRMDARRQAHNVE